MMIISDMQPLNQYLYTCNVYAYMHLAYIVLYYQTCSFPMCSCCFLMIRSVIIKNTTLHYQMTIHVPQWLRDVILTTMIRITGAMNVHIKLSL